MLGRQRAAASISAASFQAKSFNMLPFLAKNDFRETSASPASGVKPGCTSTTDTRRRTLQALRVGAY